MTPKPKIIEEEIPTAPAQDVKETIAEAVTTALVEGIAETAPVASPVAPVVAEAIAPVVAEIVTPVVAKAEAVAEDGIDGIDYITHATQALVSDLTARLGKYVEVCDHPEGKLLKLAGIDLSDTSHTHSVNEVVAQTAQKLASYGINATIKHSIDIVNGVFHFHIK